MNIFKTIGKAVGSFFGIGATSSTSPVQTIANVVDEYKYTEQEKEEAQDRRAIQDSSDTAKIMIADSRSGNSTFDTIVDAISRLQRPGWGAYFFGGLTGVWKFPTLTDINSFWLTIFTIYFTALFGGRALFKDLATAITNVINSKK